MDQNKDYNGPSLSLDAPEMMIDATSQNEKSMNKTTPNRMTLSDLGRKTGNHTEIKPRIKTQEPVSRKEISIDAVATQEQQTEQVHESPLDDMIGINNPNSMFSKYVQNKEAEAREYIIQQQEEQRVLDEEKELGESSDLSNDKKIIGIDEGYSSSNVNIKAERDEDLDLSALIKKDKKSNIEEKNDMSERENFPQETDEVSVDDMIDKNDLPTYDETTADEEDTSYDDNYEESNNNIDSNEIAKDVEEKTESIDASDVNLDEDDHSSNFEAANIEEDDDNSTTEVGEVNEDEVLKHLQKLATERLKPVSKKLDISSFTVLKKPVTNINPIFQSTSARVVKWVLPSQESVILMKEFSGSELEKLREYSENSRSIDALNRRFHMIYDHIVSPKPATFEQWLKTTPYEDVDHYFFAVYIASFKGANYIPEDCQNDKCKETFITEDVNIMDMVKFETPKAKEKFVQLYKSEPTHAGKGVYCTEIVPMTDNIAIAFRQPSIYNLIEIAALDQKVSAQYDHILEYIPYIDTIYAIDSIEKTLTPITYKMFPDNASRTTRSKLMKYDSIFSTMSVDQFGPIKAYIRAITEKTSGMYYVYPSVECPKCHQLTTEQRATAEQLVFTRYQLGSLVTTSLS